MEILELNLKHFGKFTDYKLDLHSGLNVISGGNETGKSTMHAFIRAMLYGLTRTRSRSLDEYQLRQPWEDPNNFAGSMKLLYREKIYRIDRNFLKRQESVEIVCESDGTQVEDTEAALAAFTGGLSEEDFDNTVFIRQSGAQTSTQLMEHLRDYLVNMEQTGGADTDVAGALEFLKKRRKAQENERARQEEVLDTQIRQDMQELAFVKKEIERLKERGEGEDVKSAFERVRGGEGDRSSGQENRSEADGNDEDGREPAGSRSATAVSTVQDRPARQTQQHNPLDDEDDSPYTEGPGLITAALMMVFLAAGAIMLVCAFMAAAGKMRYLMAFGGIVCLAIAARLLYVFAHPKSRQEMLVKRSQREAFLDKHLGFRDDPDDLEQESYELHRETELKKRMEQARLREERAREREKAREARLRALEDGLSGEDPSERTDRINTSLNVLSDDGESGRRNSAARLRDSGLDTSFGSGAGEDRPAGTSAAAQRRVGQAQALASEIRQKERRLSELEDELHELNAKKGALKAYDQEIRAIDLASGRITELSGKIYRESGAQFAENVSTLLAGLTEGRYDRISLDDKMQVRLNTPDKLLELERVSFGTMNQVYFALRLAAGQLLCGKERIPVVLDEVFAMYDDERLESALRCLESMGRQVILFTCQSRELDVLARIRKQA